jgi:prephenate dehydrogenase
MKTTVIGLGLIGGCIALDLKKSGIATAVVGIDLNPVHADKALELGLVDSLQTEEESLPTSDLVIMAIPVNALSKLLPRVLDVVKKDTVVIDAGSTKSLICRAVTTHTNRGQFTR